MLEPVEQAIEILEQGLEENAAPAAEWSKEPPTEEGLYFVLTKNCPMVVMRNVVQLFEHSPLALQGFGHSGTICTVDEMDKDTLWQKINVPALPGEGGAEC